MQPRLQAIVQGSIDAAAAAAAAADAKSDESPSTRRAASAAAAAIVDMSRALCGLASSFLALHPDSHFSEAGCKDLHDCMAACLSDAQGRVVQVEQQRLLLLISAGGMSAAADAMDWLQSQPLDLMSIVADVACSLHRCCGGCRPKQVSAMVLECVKAIAALVHKNAQQHYDYMQIQVACELTLPHSSHRFTFDFFCSFPQTQLPLPLFPPNTRPPTPPPIPSLHPLHGHFFACLSGLLQ